MQLTTPPQQGEVRTYTAWPLCFKNSRDNAGGLHHEQISVNPMLLVLDEQRLLGQSPLRLAKAGRQKNRISSTLGNGV